MQKAQQINAPETSLPPGASWSNALLIGSELAVSGLHARQGDGSIRGGADMEAQTRACLDKLDALLTAAGGSLNNVYKLIAYVTDIAQKDAVNTARKALFGPVYPCSTLMEVNRFAFEGVLVEIDAFARLDVVLNDTPIK